ncbi:MAG: CotH kinase family protein, partial [bacterium]
WMDSNPASLSRNFEKKTNESENDWSDLFDLVDLLNNSIDLENELPDILNIDRTCWYFAMCDVLVNLDSYIYEGHNYFIYHDPASDQFHMIPWDMNEAFGCFPAQGLTLKQLEQFPVVPTSLQFQLPLVDRMLNIPTFKQRYLTHIRTLLNHEIHPDSMQKRIDALHNLIDMEVKSDQNKLYSYEYFKKNVYDPVVIQGNRTAPGLLELIQNRRNFLLQKPDVIQIAPKIISAQCLSENPEINTSINFNALLDGPQTGTTVTLFYRFQDGIFLSETMMDNGLHSDQDADDGLFGCSVSLSEALEGTCLEYYVQAKNEEGVVQFFPERAEFELLSIILAGNADLPDLVINEFMAANDAAFADPQGDYDDWIEIYNRSTESFSLKGLYLTDNLGNLKKWAFPDTVLHGQDYLIIWADKDEDDFPGLHCSFKLDKSGEVIALIDQDENDNQIINACIFDAQETDHSMARIPNGEGTFIITDMVTPLTANTTKTQVNRKKQLLSKDFRLDQNYPNPFNNQTRITFQVRTAGNVKIELYNLQGQYVRTLTDGLYSPGFHHIQLDASGLPSGIYIYILHTENGFQEKRKMVLMK